MKGSSETGITENRPSFPRCFVCGKDNPIGLKLNFSLEDGKASASFTPNENHAGWEPTVHGGIISSLLDEALIYAVFAATGRYGVTAELRIRFKRPLQIHQTCTVQGWLEEDRKRLWIAGSKIIDDEGRLLAEAHGKIFPIK